jgi:hypothetical protein
MTTQNPNDDCAFFCMLYLENYNGRDWEMVIQIDKVSGQFISAIFSFVNSQPFIHSSNLPFIEHSFNNAPFLSYFEQDRAHEYRA